MFRPRSEPPAAYSCVCPTGGVRYYFRTATPACGSKSNATKNELICPEVLAWVPGGRACEYEYIDVDEESDQAESREHDRRRCDEQR